jgi:hypothetical protein
MNKPHSKISVAVPGRTTVGFVHPDGIAWLSKNQNTGSSVQLLGAPKDGADVAVYVDTADLGASPPADVVDAVDINPADLRVETWRSNRGGWCTKPDNCCRITHVPTGITVTVEGDEDARSVHAAKVQAMEKLKVELARRAAGAGATDQAGLADRVAAVLAAHGISVRPSICAQVAGEVVAGMGPVLTKAAFEEIAEGWDGCKYDDAMIDDIGAGLRRDFDRLASQASPKFVRDREADRKTLGNDAFNGWLDTKLYNSEQTVWGSLGEMSPTQAAWVGWFYRNVHGTAPELTAAAEALADNLAALVRQLVFALRKARPDHPAAERALSYLTRKGLVGSPLRLADAQPHAPGDDDIRDVLQDAANLAHAYGHPELYTKLKRLMSALSVRLSSEQVAGIAATAATEILPLYIGHFTEQALQGKLEEVVSAAIARAAGLYGDQRHAQALEEVAHLHTIVNTVALRLRETNLMTLAEKLEDCAASVELVLRAPVVAPNQG